MENGNAEVDNPPGPRRFFPTIDEDSPASKTSFVPDIIPRTWKRAPLMWLPQSQVDIDGPAIRGIESALYMDR